MKHFVFFFILISILFPLRGYGASDSTKNNPSILQPTIKGFSPVFSKDHLDRYRRNPDFDYREKRIDNPFENFLIWLRNLFNEKAQATLNNIIVYRIFEVLIVLVVLFALYKILGMEKLGLFEKKNKNLIPFSGELSFEKEEDFEVLIKEAIRLENYREAIRIWYYKILLDLDRRGLINWKPSKSNQNYLNEMHQNQDYTSFQTLTYYFEYSFYGGFEVNAGQYQEIQVRFQNFINRKKE